MTTSETAFQHFRQGDIEPFYRMHYADMVIYASRLLGMELSYMAEDCVQNAVMQTYLHREELGQAGIWLCYLLRCVRNNAISQLRKLNTHMGYADSCQTESNEEEDIQLAYIRQETQAILYAAVESLPEEMRELMRMSFIEGLRNAEIAERLGVAEITVKKRKARMLAMLRERLGPEAYLLLILLSILTKTT